ncbi:alveolin domain containing intermediate filament IMC14 [Toxoplasma gondii ME49]|uniref:Alveolin domain containing intermediate filament IMC14 n=6 Tax=Toxoplasma gondii TaxID=5811 RepID=S7UYY7_TOXGG|nr:alveolin domain containing intermediate filament IMC14 [Toxoplasma gondii ME49]EPR62817.1 alveolin domain containing intermediate filament IMC14 [Toxoplasma gondii GT1]KAF4641169.1 alveolin domain containing intermediate filament IMC14 [Toxoplasma gondii]KFH15259.1 alveolin domain containing intermediate filament IMC14 [Toxoplasma gondii MAS]KYF41525.1 alveolin domain containing intermediate filament IMC14 [Toxoplasma gondii ARI]PIM05297.1 alveolin domain containing intermediate filament IM|eukprot:XP_018637075.1 alveolin domain containing intermediate filament IMC14 [Toxoplasma gondii ME49]
MELCESPCCEPRERLPAIPVLPLATVGGLPASQTLIEEKVTYTTKPIVAEQIIEVPQVEYRDHLVEERQTVFVEKVIHVPRTEIQERIVEVPRHVTREVVVDVPQVQVVEKFVEIPTPIYQEKIIPVARPVIKQKTTHVPKPVLHEKFVEVPRVYYKPVTVEKIVEVPEYRIEYKYRDVPVPQKVFRVVPFDRIRYVPQIRYVDKIVKKPEIRTNSVPVFESTQGRSVKVASPRRVPISGPATPVLMEREQREVAYCDSLMEGLFGCFMPATPVEKQACRGVSRRRMRLRSPRSPPINMDVVVMSRSPRNRRSRRVFGDCCSSDVAEVRTPRLMHLPAPTPVAGLAVSSVQHPSLKRPQPVPYPLPSPPSLPTMVSPCPPPEAMIETKLGAMTFRQFEKLNNEDILGKHLRPYDIPTSNGQVDSCDTSKCSTLPRPEETTITSNHRQIHPGQLFGEGALSSSAVSPRGGTRSSDISEVLQRQREELKLRIEHERIHAERLRLACLAEEKRMQLLELEEQQRQVRLQAHKQQTEYEAQQQLFAREQEHLQKEALAGDVMIQTRYGPMKFQEFEKLNNEDFMKSPRGLQISTCNTMAYSPSLATPRTQAGETDYRTHTSVAYVGGTASVPQQVPIYQEAPVILSPRVVVPNRGPVYLQEHQPMYLPRTFQCSHHGDCPVGGLHPTVGESHDEDLLDERYTIQLQQLTKIAFRNAYQAGLNVYEGVRSLVNWGKSG